MNCAASETVYAAHQTTAQHATPDANAENSAAEVRALNGLIVGILDNIDDFRRAIFAIEQHAAILQRRLHSRLQAVEQLQCRVRAIGGEPATTRSTLATAFARLLAAREPLARNHREEVLRDVDRGDEAVKRQFQHCLASERWFGHGKQCVHEVLEAIMADRLRNVESWSPHNAMVAAKDASGLGGPLNSQLITT